MRYKTAIRRLFEQVTGTRLYRTLPRGVDVFADIRTALPSVAVETILDVGANLGCSTIAFAAHYPSAAIYSFEPVSDTYQKLQVAMRGRSHVHTFRLALGADAGLAQMVLQGTPDMFHVQTTEVTTDAGADVEQVAIQTVDAFCQSRSIDRINILKVDTEGRDLDVLRGAHRMLSDQTIDIVQVEASMNWNNRRHVPFHDFSRLLEPLGYFLFGIYEQKEEWTTGTPILRRSNPVFISSDVVQKNTLALGLSMI